jgi:hypothetical protein
MALLNASARMSGPVPVEFHTAIEVCKAYLKSQWVICQQDLAVAETEETVSWEEAECSEDEDEEEDEGVFSRHASVFEWKLFVPHDPRSRLLVLRTCMVSTT